MHFDTSVNMYIYTYLEPQMNPIFEGQPPKTMAFPIKTRVIWVLYIHETLYFSTCFKLLSFSNKNTHLQHFEKYREAKKPSISAALNSASMAGSEAGEIHLSGGTTFLVPIGSMYGIFTYIGWKMATWTRGNVSKYSKSRKKPDLGLKVVNLGLPNCKTCFFEAIWVSVVPLLKRKNHLPSFFPQSVFPRNFYHGFFPKTSWEYFPRDFSQQKAPKENWWKITDPKQLRCFSICVFSPKNCFWTHRKWGCWSKNMFV